MTSLDFANLLVTIPLEWQDVPLITPGTMGGYLPLRSFSAYAVVPGLPSVGLLFPAIPLTLGTSPLTARIVSSRILALPLAAQSQSIWVETDQGPFPVTGVRLFTSPPKLTASYVSVEWKFARLWSPGNPPDSISPVSGIAPGIVGAVDLPLAPHIDP